MSSMSPPIDPVAQGEIPDQRSTWPKVIGIIAIVLGICGLGCTCIQAGSQFMMERFLAMAEQGNMPREELAKLELQTELLRDFMALTLSLAVVGLVLAGWLLINGIGLTMRKGWTGRSCMLWSIAKALFVFGSVGVAFYMAGVTTKRMEEAGITLTPFEQTMQTLNPLIFGVWGLVLPVFLMIWFSRGKIRNEVSSWSEYDRQVI